MTLEDIPANQTTVLTDVMDRLFRMAGCDPTCHCCHVPLNIGDSFELAVYDKQKLTNTNETRHTEDIMLCDECDAEDMAKMEARVLRKHRKWLRDNPRAGYTRPHRLVVLPAEWLDEA